MIGAGAHHESIAFFEVQMNFTTGTCEKSGNDVEYLGHGGVSVCADDGAHRQFRDRSLQQAGPHFLPEDDELLDRSLMGNRLTSRHFERNKDESSLVNCAKIW